MKILTILVMSSLFILTNSIKCKEFDKYTLMNNIMDKPDKILEICSDTTILGSRLSKWLNDTSYVNDIKYYLKKYFSAYRIIILDTISKMERGDIIIAYHHYVKYINELGDMFCFHFIKDIKNGRVDDWKLISFGDYEVWDPYPKCDDKK